MISEAMSASNDTNNDRFLFILNRCDQLEIQETDSIQDKIDSCIEHLAKHKIAHPRIFPVASKVSKAIKIKESGQTLNPYDKLALTTYMNKLSISDDYQFENYASIPVTAKSQIKELLKRAQEEATAADTYNNKVIAIHSGFVSFEYAIKDYLLKYAYPLKIRSMLNSFHAILNEVQMWENVKKNFAESLLKSEEEREKNQDKQKSEIVRSQKIESDIQSGTVAKNIKGEIDNLKFNDFEIKKIESNLYNQIRVIKQKYSQGENAVPPEKAQQILTALNSKVFESIKNAETSIRDYVDRDINSKIKQLLEKYDSYVQQLIKLGFTSIGSLDICKTVSFDNVKNISKNELDHKVEKATHDDTHKEYNSERDWKKSRGLFKNIWMKLTQPKTVEVKTAVANIHILITELINPLTAQFSDAIGQSIVETSKYIDGLKSEAKASMDKCDKVIIDKHNEYFTCISELERLSNDEKDLETRQLQFSKNIEWLETMKSSLENLFK